jgi:hypothetical protein
MPHNYVKTNSEGNILNKKQDFTCDNICSSHKEGRDEYDGTKSKLDLIIFLILKELKSVCSLQCGILYSRMFFLYLLIYPFFSQAQSV